MTNLDKHEWEFDPHEQYIIDYLEARGFAVTINKRYVSTDHITIELGGIPFKTGFPCGDKKLDRAAIAKRIVEDFNLYCKLLAMRDELAGRAALMNGGDEE